MGRAVVVIIVDGGGNGQLVSSWGVSILEWAQWVGVLTFVAVLTIHSRWHSLLIVDVALMPFPRHLQSWWLSGSGWSSPYSSSSRAVVVVLIFCLAVVGNDTSLMVAVVASSKVGRPLRDLHVFPHICSSDRHRPAHILRAGRGTGDGEDGGGGKGGHG